MERGNGRRDSSPPKALKILWVSDAPWHSTGYGITTEHITQRMARDGHKMFVFAPGAFQQGSVRLGPNLTVLSSEFGDDRWGNQSLHYHIDGVKPDLIITWLDCQGLGEYGWTAIPTYMWAPIDTWPVQADERAILGRAQRLLVPSTWGQGVLSAQDIHSTYLPCGIDLEAYDVSAADRGRWRSQLGPELDDDTFLIGMVGLNSGAPDRKGYGFAFDIIKAFAASHEKVRAYIHTNYHGDGVAINLQDLRHEMEMEDLIYFVRPFGPLGAPVEYMRGAYNAFDVFLHCGNGEGFGLPVAEAQACGTPVVANACSSVTELLGPGSVPCQPLGDMMLQPCTRVALPSVQNMLEGLETAYGCWRDGRVDRQEVRAGILHLDRDAIYERDWRAVLQDVPQPLDYSAAGPKKLMLAAGMGEKQGYIHHDREKLWPHIEVAHDLEEFPWPWQDDSWDYIEFSDCLEHLRSNATAVLDELWRILKPGGYVYIHTAEAGSWQLNMDPTHAQGFYIDSFDYYDPATRRGQAYSYSLRKWRVVRKTRDDGGLAFVLQPRKEALVPA
ncbi:hypothetical protein LCGC14_0979770 [marine sediment metagenome]|uniref:Uncharacterized protein n=1 Tax=marine sediment metagenome TaxID=412755 RepID=A0A0F9QSE4_9ZZZZ